MEEDCKKDEEAPEAKPEELKEEADDNPAEGKKPKSKHNVIVAIVAIVAVICVGVFWYVDYEAPHQQAVDAFNEAKSGLDERNAELDSAISDLQGVQASDVKPLDPATDDAATAAISGAQAARQDVPAMPGGTNDINVEAQQLSQMGDYADQLAQIATAKDALQKSIQQMQQVTNPSEVFVLQRLTGLPDVTGSEAVSEGNDPNNELGKQGSYTATVYFTSGLVDQSQVHSSPGYTGIVAKGNDGGGTVEVYATTDDANKRNDYLGAFDGNGFLSPGSHEVFGTCVVRTSRLLTASKQQTLTKEVEGSLSALQ